MLPWLWYRPAAAIAPIRPLAWEPPFVSGVALKRKKNVFITLTINFLNRSHNHPNLNPNSLLYKLIQRHEEPSVALFQSEVLFRRIIALYPRKSMSSSRTMASRSAEYIQNHRNKK